MVFPIKSYLHNGKQMEKKMVAYTIITQPMLWQKYYRNIILYQKAVQNNLISKTLNVNKQYF